jgi:hypothetical protein
MSEDKGMKQYLQLVLAVLLALAFLWLATFNLENAPPVWWDEGWTTSVARNWKENFRPTTETRTDLWIVRDFGP